MSYPSSLLSCGPNAMGSATVEVLPAPIAEAFIMSIPATGDRSKLRNDLLRRGPAPAKLVTVVTPPGCMAALKRGSPLPGVPPRAWPIHFETLHAPGANNTPSRKIVSPRHIIMPFNLEADPDSINNTQNGCILASLFPECKFRVEKAGAKGRFLTLEFAVLPPTPRPLSIAGLPTFFKLASSQVTSPNPRGIPMPEKNTSWDINEDYRGLKSWRSLFGRILINFDWLKVPITEVLYCDDYVVIVLQYHDMTTSLFPREIGNLEVRYLVEKQMKRPGVPQYRPGVSTPGSPDEGMYQVLRPGVRISGPSAASEKVSYRSSAGVLVRDEKGAEYLTVAGHDFRTDPHDIRHPLAHHSSIGQFARRVGATGTGLVSLRDGTRFVNETFQSAAVLQPVALKRFAPVMNRRTGPVFFDAPDTGCVEGTLIVSSFQRVGPAGGDAKWILTFWVYMDQNIGPIPHGASGSAVWTEEGDVLGTVGYAPTEGVMKGWVHCIAAEEFMDAGLEVVDTSEPHVDALEGTGSL